MRKTMVYLENTQHQRLAQLARSRGTTMAALLRRAVDRLLDEERAERPTFSFIGIGAGSDDDDRVSEHPHEAAGRALSTERPS